MHTLIHDADRITPGSWTHMRKGGVVVTCPRCCNQIAVGVGAPGLTHRIEKDGSVTPRLRCRGKDADGHQCTFDDYLNLQDYNRLAKPIPPQDRH